MKYPLRSYSLFFNLGDVVYKLYKRFLRKIESTTAAGKRGALLAGLTSSFNKYN